MRSLVLALLVSLPLSLQAAQLRAEDAVAPAEDTVPPDERPGVFELHWVSTPLATAPAPEGTVETRSYYRYLRLPLEDVRVASVTYFKMPVPAGAPADAYDPDRMGRLLKKAFGLPGWRSSREGGARVFTADWDVVNKLLRVVIRNTGRSYIISVAMIRKSYSERTVADTALLQQRLAESAPEQPSGWPAWMDSLFGWLDPSGPAAWAGPGGGGVTDTETGPIVPYTAGVWNQATSQFRDADQETAVVATANAGLSSTFSGFLGSFFGNIAGEAVSSVLDFALKAFFKPQKSEQDMYRDFVQARAEYEKHYAEIAKLEKFIPIALRIVKEIQQAGGRDQLLARYQHYLDLSKARKAADKLRIDKLLKAPKTQANREALCRIDHQMEQNQSVLDAIAANTKILNSLPDNEFTKAPNAKYDPVCGNFVKRLQQFISAEEALENIRGTLIDNQQGYTHQITQSFLNEQKRARGSVANLQLESRRAVADQQLLNCEQPLQELFKDPRLAKMLASCVRQKKRQEIPAQIPVLGIVTGPILGPVFYKDDLLQRECERLIGTPRHPYPPDLQEAKKTIDANCLKRTQITEKHYDDLIQKVKDGVLLADQNDVNQVVDDFNKWIDELVAENTLARQKKTKETLKRELENAEKASCAIEDDKLVAAKP